TGGGDEDVFVVAVIEAVEVLGRRRHAGARRGTTRGGRHVERGDDGRGGGGADRHVGLVGLIAAARVEADAGEHHQAPVHRRRRGDDVGDGRAQVIPAA